MKAYIGNTDYDWFRYLSERGDLDEVNFWRPAGGTAFRVLKRGEPFIFKLKAAYGHAIVGFGLFALFKPLTIFDAWQLFGCANGAESIHEVVVRVGKYTRSQATANHVIGCVLVATPIFFPRELWIKSPSDWSGQIVQGKSYDLNRGEGRRIWHECLERTQHLALPEPAQQNVSMVAEGTNRSDGYLVKPRIGQGLFRLTVADAYQRCAVSGEHALPALDAAHIKPFASGGPHDVRNGLLLRADIHRLFDRGYVTVTPDYRFKVSTQLDLEFHNGKIYYEQDGSRIWHPTDQIDCPSREFLDFHNSEVFLG
jgi:HNH endonuclease